MVTCTLDWLGLERCAAIILVNVKRSVLGALYGVASQFGEDGLRLLLFHGARVILARETLLDHCWHFQTRATGCVSVCRNTALCGIIESFATSHLRVRRSSYRRLTT